MVVGPEFLALGLVLVLLVLIPARRLQLAGFGARTIGAYAASLWLLGLVVADPPRPPADPDPAPPGRLPGAVHRLARRARTGSSVAAVAAASGAAARPTTPPPGARPPIKNVTPPDEPGAAG